MIPTQWFLILSALLFTIGVCGVLTRRNGITIFMSIELMVNAVNLTFHHRETIDVDEANLMRW